MPRISLGGLDANGYTSNVLVRSAVERQLEILGEACRRALDDRVLATVVVDTVRRDVPRLRQLLQVELARFPVD